MKYLFYLLLVLITLNTQLHTKSITPNVQTKIDSLEMELSHLKVRGDTNEVKLLFELSSTYRVTNPTNGIKYGMMANKIAKNINWEIGIAKSYNSIASNYLGLSKYSDALDYYQRALEINEKLGNKIGISAILGNLAIVYTIQSNYPKGLEYFQKSLKISEEMNDSIGIASNLGNIGIIFYKQLNYSKALEYYKKALIINKKRDSKSKIAINLGNIGNIYSKQTNYPNAIEYYKQALNINKDLGNKEGIATNLTTIAVIYMKNSNYPKSLEYYNKALSLYEKLGNKYKLAICYENIGQLYLNLSQDSIIAKIKNESTSINLDKEFNMNKSIKYLLYALKLDKEVGALTEQLGVLNNLQKVYSLKGNYYEAFNTLTKFNEIKDTVYSEKNRNKIAALEKAREDDVNRITIAKQKVELNAQKKERAYIIYSAIGGILSVLLILGVIFSQRRKSDELLYNVLPISIAKRLKKKEHPISDYFEQASIIFIDIVGFTTISKNEDPSKIVEFLNSLFSKYDGLAKKYGLEKIKTIGDSYMAAAGIPLIQEDNSYRAAQMALEVKQMMKDYYTPDGTKIEVRIGLDCGPVVAGVIGENKFIYDMWSDAVNTASRMESSSIAGHVQVSERFKQAVSQFQDFDYIERGEIEIKGKGMMMTYFIDKK